MKETLLAKSNIRKGKSLAIGLLLLITLAACFLNIVLVIFNDFKENSYKHAERLNTEDVLLLVHGSEKNKIDENYISSLISGYKDIEIKDNLVIDSEVKYNDGTINTTVIIEDEESALNAKIGKIELMDVDESIKKNYIYLPNQFKVGGKHKVGEMFELKVANKTYKYKIKGFINSIGLGSYNAGAVKVVVPKIEYDTIRKEGSSNLDVKIVKFKLNDGTSQSKFANTITTKLEKEKNISSNALPLEMVILARTFISTILGVCFAVVSIVIIIIVLLMLSNSISNYITDNIKTIGALKSIGYTSGNIKASFIIQFMTLTIIGCVLGIGLSYLMLPTIIDTMTTQSGIPCVVSLNIVWILVTLFTILFVVFLSVILFTKKIKKIEPITALRDGVNTHNFKKNRIALEKSILPLNLSLALKTMFNNIKQNIATFIITFFLVFSGVISLIMYQNFSREPNVSLMTFEYSDGAVLADKDLNKDIYNYMSSIEGVKNVRAVTSFTLKNDDNTLYSYILDDADKLYNKDVCYKGRLPKYDNEIAISGKYGSTYKYNIGDEIIINKGEKKAKYLVTGYIQSFNNMGQEAVLLETGITRLINNGFNKQYYYDVEDGYKVDDINKNIQDKFGDRITSTANIEKIMKASIATFVTISNIMVIFIMTVSFIVILLILYLLMKTFIGKKRKDYGILKATGYTSRNIIFQNAISFMPSIVLSVIISSIVSYFIANPYLETITKSFGVMKLTFDVPIDLMIIMGIGFIVISYLITLFLSLKLRKIEPYNLLKDE